MQKEKVEINLELVKKKFGYVADSNLRPRDYESNHLTKEA